MRIIADESSRDDLIFRNEIKYLFPSADVGKLRRILVSNCRRLIYNEPVSTVRSIYLDTWNLTAAHANLDGIGRRQKVRLRWYDHSEPPAVFFFEIKWRKNRLTGKKRIKVHADRPLFLTPYRRTVSDLAILLKDSLAYLLMRYCEPVIIVEYKREHFASPDGDLRLTLDYDLVFYDQLGKQKPSISFGIPIDQQVILESKGREISGSKLRMLLHPLSPRVSRCSKYVNGCQRLGMVK